MQEIRAQSQNVLLGYIFVKKIVLLQNIPTSLINMSHHRIYFPQTFQVKTLKTANVQATQTNGFEKSYMQSYTPAKSELFAFANSSFSFLGLTFFSKHFFAFSNGFVLSFFIPILIFSK